MRALPAAPGRRRSLGDVGAVGLAVAVIVGAKVARPLPLVIGLAVGLIALSMRRPWLLLVGGALLASALGARAEAGLHPIRAGPVRGVVSLASDPSPTFSGMRALVRWQGRRLEVRASGSAAGAIAASLAGETITVQGMVRPAPPDRWLRVNHVVGIVEATSAERTSAGTGPWRAANRVRRLLERGAASLPPTTRALFTGFVLGDDRAQPATVADDFRAAGLTHLLAVSGQNVAFVLALLAPVVRRLRLGGRWAVTVGAIAFFALITRGEPSVLRAALMAVLAVTAGSLGRPVSPVRLVAFAVAVLVLVDPFLVDSVGFRLSVGATLGIVLLAPSLAASLPGPTPMAEGLGVTLAAQAGVAPVILSSFGGLPVVSVPANLLAVPVAGLVMMWGLGAGIVAGFVGGEVAAALHVPTRLMISWIAGVAERAAALPLGDIQPAEALVFVAGLVLVVAGVRSKRPILVRPGYALVVLALVAPVVALRVVKPPLRVEPATGVVLWRARGATLVELSGAAQEGRLLTALRRAGVRRVDLVLLRSGGPAAAKLTAALRHRWSVGRVFQPAGGTVPDAEVPVVGSSLRVGPFTATIRAVRPRLEVRIRSPVRSKLD